jgi:hypothetical protein
MFNNSSIDTIPHDAAALPFGELPTIPQWSPTGILADGIPPSIIVLDPGADGSPTTKERTSRGTSCTQHADAAPAELLKYHKVSAHSYSSLTTCSHLSFSVAGSACFYRPFG